MFGYSIFSNGGGSGSGGTPEPTSGDYRVRFIDYDGVVLKTAYCNSGGSVTPPSDPDHTDIGLTFQEWNYSGSLSSITSDLNINATHTSSDGKTKFKIKLTPISGKSPTIYINKSSSFELTVDWGDENTTTDSTSGDRDYNHTYADYGEYTISLYISSGSGTYGFGNGSASSTCVGGNTQAYRDILTEVLIGENVIAIGDYAFFANRSLMYISMPNTITTIGQYAIYGCDSLVYLGIPDGATSLGQYAIAYNPSLQEVSLPSGITSIGVYCLSFDYALRSIVILSGATAIPDYCFYNDYALNRAWLTDGIISIGICAFYYNWSLCVLHIPTSLQIIYDEAFSRCSANPYISLPPTMTNIGTAAFYQNRSLKSLICAATTPPTVGGNNMLGEGVSILIISVPSASLSAYQAATYWSTYANYMEGY